MCVAKQNMPRCRLWFDTLLHCRLRRDDSCGNWAWCRVRQLSAKDSICGVEVMCDLGYPSSTWKQWLHLTFLSEVCPDSSWGRVRSSTIDDSFIFEFSWRPTHVPSMWTQVCLSGNRTWRHGACSEAAWVIDTWRVWKPKGLCTLKLPREAHFGDFSQVCFQRLSKGFSSISSHFQGKNFTKLVLSFG